MDIYTQEEFILEAFVLLIASLFWIQAMICELFQRRKEINEFTRHKFKKIAQYAYSHFAQENRQTARAKTVDFLKEVDKKGLLNQKYDLIKGA